MMRVLYPSKCLPMVWAYLLLSSQGFAQLLPISDSLKLVVQVGQAESVRYVSFSPDGHSARFATQTDTIKEWALTGGTSLRTTKEIWEGFSIMAFSPDSTVAIISNNSREFRIHDVATRRLLHTAKGHTGVILSLAFAPHGRNVVSGSIDKTVKLWDIATGREIRTFGGVNCLFGYRVMGHEQWVTAVTFSPDGQTVLSGSEDTTLKLWEVSTGQCLQTLRGHTARINAVAFSPDGRFGLSGSLDGTMRLWDLAAGKELLLLLPIGNKGDWVAMTPQGQYDGTAPGILQALHYLLGAEVIDVDPENDPNYQPGLIPKILSQ